MGVLLPNFFEVNHEKPVTINKISLGEFVVYFLFKITLPKIENLIAPTRRVQNNLLFFNCKITSSCNKLTFTAQ